MTRGYSTRKLEEFYRVTHKQICNWADRFDVEGIAGLRIKPGRGRHSFITEEQKEQVKKDLLQSPEAFGYNTANWSGPLLQKHLECVYRVIYKQAAVEQILRKIVKEEIADANKFIKENEITGSLANLQIYNAMASIMQRLSCSRLNLSEEQIDKIIDEEIDRISL